MNGDVANEPSTVVCCFFNVSEHPLLGTVLIENKTMQKVLVMFNAREKVEPYR